MKFEIIFFCTLFHPLSPIFTHFHSFSPIFTHFHPFLSFVDVANNDGESPIDWHMTQYHVPIVAQSAGSLADMNLCSRCRVCVT